MYQKIHRQRYHEIYWLLLVIPATPPLCKLDPEGNHGYASADDRMSHHLESLEVGEDLERMVLVTESVDDWYAAILSQCSQRLVGVNPR